MNSQTDASRTVDALRGAGTIVSYTDEEGRHPYVRQAALEAARQHGARLILYPLDEYSPLSNPLPNEWGSEGEGAPFGDPLSVEDLELLGHDWLAAQVVEAAQAGVDAGAGLPEGRGVPAMVEYARAHDAGAVLLPREALTDAGSIASLMGKDADAAAEAERSHDVAVLLVDPAGQIRHATEEEPD